MKRNVERLPFQNGRKVCWMVHNKGREKDPIFLDCNVPKSRDTRPSLNLLRGRWVRIKEGGGPAKKWWTINIKVGWNTQKRTKVVYVWTLRSWNHRSNLILPRERRVRIVMVVGPPKSCFITKRCKMNPVFGDSMDPEEPKPRNQISFFWERD